MPRKPKIKKSTRKFLRIGGVLFFLLLVISAFAFIRVGKQSSISGSIDYIVDDGAKTASNGEMYNHSVDRSVSSKENRIITQLNNGTYILNDQVRLIFEPSFSQDTTYTTMELKVTLIDNNKFFTPQLMIGSDKVVSQKTLRVKYFEGKVSTGTWSWGMLKEYTKPHGDEYLYVDYADWEEGKFYNSIRTSGDWEGVYDEQSANAFGVEPILSTSDYVYAGCPSASPDITYLAGSQKVSHTCYSHNSGDSYFLTTVYYYNVWDKEPNLGINVYLNVPDSDGDGVDDIDDVAPEDASIRTTRQVSDKMQLLTFRLADLEKKIIEKEARLSALESDFTAAEAELGDTRIELTSLYIQLNQTVSDYQRTRVELDAARVTLDQVYAKLNEASQLHSDIYSLLYAADQITITSITDLARAREVLSGENATLYQARDLILNSSLSQIEKNNIRGLIDNAISKNEEIRQIILLVETQQQEKADVERALRVLLDRADSKINESTDLVRSLQGQLNQTSQQMKENERNLKKQVAELEEIINTQPASTKPMLPKAKTILYIIIIIVIIVLMYSFRWYYKS